jgi:hypothetical protein
MLGVAMTSVTTGAAADGQGAKGPLLHLGTPENGATLSRCRRFRYDLRRSWDADKPVMCWVMLNPSTADEVDDDPTIRKCIGFAERHGCGAIGVVNLWAYRATDWRQMRDAMRRSYDLDDFPIDGDRNRRHVLSVASLAERVVVGWGAHANGVSSSWPKQLARALKGEGHELMCFGTTKDGSPRHPLMLAYDTPMVSWEPQP